MTAVDETPRIPRLRIVGVGKSYAAVRALDGIDLTIKPGEVHALCGHNGAGKSTLVKILSGVVRHDDGSVYIDGEEADFRGPEQAQRAGVALVDQEISLIEALSVRDNIMLGLAGAPFFARPNSADGIIHGLLGRVGLGDLSLSTPVASLALGKRQLVEIARALGRGGKILILDEPTATLTESESDQVFAAVKSVATEGISVIYVSHRLGEVLEICDTISVFRDGRRIATRPADQMDRAELIDLMVGVQAVDRSANADRTPLDSKPSLVVRGLSVGTRVHDVDLTIRPGQVVALAGQVGSGASEILRAIAGLAPDAVGTVRVGEKDLRLGSPVRSLNAGVNYISNDRKAEGLFLTRTVRVNLLATRLRAIARHGFVVSRLAKEIGALLAEASGLRERERSAVGELSGGNQQKAFLGRCLHRDKGASLLLLDEPTRGVDVGGRSDIHDLIRNAAGSGTAVLYASTELDEILDLADEVVTLRAGRVVSVRPRAHITAQALLYEMTHVETEAVSA
ncbi:ABC-type sugar transport system ATPase subunit [Nocardioides ginsengisegetis]|uniref:ABC-type sugar transport system ATPase subunit n=1 Tax=Nocardioides ginsengisegetis TaxID=661491 RepID=A0A7W3P984_9ACTN|nr:ABC-type sugar transport system ATPase subunit [Nocardioides ginsengisegetis]